MYDVETNITMDSRRHKSPGVKFGNNGLPKGAFEEKLPKHRFTDYSKSEVCFKLLEKSESKLMKSSISKSYLGDISKMIKEEKIASNPGIL